ncbi:MAG: serine/threonine protein kinase, partial [Planctomycetes bacterium]|nr:serine/threonine protein kinase [Planctomycetota bacterium]
AHGGMGVVFEAKQISLGRRVALKVVRSSRFASEAELRRFRVEAESIARLDHSGIVAVHEVGESDGEHFYSMAFVDGGSLADIEAPLAASRAAEIMRSVAEAVHYAHTRNIVHRDLKPANVLLTAAGEPKVSDFGLARDTSSESDLTLPGSIVGTPGFMPPEQAKGRTEDVGPHADVYGLGAVLYFLLTGRPPFVGGSVVDTLHLVIHEPPTDPSRLRPD